MMFRVMSKKRNNLLKRANETICPSIAWKMRFLPLVIDSGYMLYHLQGSKLRGAEGQNAPELSPNGPRLLNLGAKSCYPIQPDICFEA